MRRYNPSSAAPKKLASDGSTVGDFLAELQEKSDAKAKTLEGYASALRKIVADIIGQGMGEEAELPGGRRGDKPLRVSNWRN